MILILKYRDILMKKTTVYINDTFSGGDLLSSYGAFRLSYCFTISTVCLCVHSSWCNFPEITIFASLTRTALSQTVCI